MDFNEKLVSLRKQKGLTQEELAKKLYVSRTAVSKWESGRGYPNIESLKAIAKLFSVTVDELLSGEELLTAAEAESKEKSNSVIFVFMDCIVGFLLFLPFFGQKTGEQFISVSALNLTEINVWIKYAYVFLITVSALFGIFQLVLQNYKNGLMRYKYLVSMVLSIAGLFVFIVSSQPYAGAFLLFILIIKLILIIKNR